MSPTFKKVFLIGGAAVAGYVIYVKVIKKAPVVVQPAVAGPIVGGLKIVPNVTVTPTAGSKRGVAGYLGSLGRSGR